LLKDIFQKNALNKATNAGYETRFVAR